MAYINELLTNNGVGCEIASFTRIHPVGPFFDTPALERLSRVVMTEDGERPGWAAGGGPDVKRILSLTESLLMSADEARRAAGRGAAPLFACESAARAWLQRPQLRVAQEDLPLLDVSQRVADAQARQAIESLRATRAGYAGDGEGLAAARRAEERIRALEELLLKRLYAGGAATSGGDAGAMLSPLDASLRERRVRHPRRRGGGVDDTLLPVTADNVTANFMRSPHYRPGTGQEGAAPVFKEELRPAALLLQHPTVATDWVVARRAAGASLGPVPEAEPGRAPSRLTPLVDTVAGWAAHVRSDCPDCVDRSCLAGPLWQMLHAVPLVLTAVEERRMTERLGRLEGGRFERTYPLNVASDTFCTDATCALLNSGAVLPINPAEALVFHPAFDAVKATYVAPAEASALVAAGPRALIGTLQTRANQLFAAAHAGLAPGVHPSASAIMRAITDSAYALKRRLVIDYSAFLNQHLGGARWRFAYINWVDILQRICPGAWVGLEDVWAGFHALSHHPDSWKYRGVRLSAGLAYLRTHVTFGEGEAPATFSGLTGEMVATLRRLLMQDVRDGILSADEMAAILVFVDDFIYAAKTRAGALHVRERLRRYAAELNIFFNEKAREPAQRQLVLGLILDTVDMTLELPPEKVCKYVFHLSLVIAALTAGCPVPRALAQRVAGQVASSSAVVPGLRYELTDVYRALGARHDPLAVVDGDVDVGDAGRRERLIRQLSSIRDALPANPLRLVPLGPSASALTMPTSLSDASGAHDSDAPDLPCGGAGLHIGQLVYHCTFASASGRIPSRELLPIVLYLDFHGSAYRGLTFCAEVDSSVVFSAINRGTTDDDEMRPLLQWLGRLAREHSFDIVARWRPREANAFADDLSKTRESGLPALVSRTWGTASLS